MNTISTIDVTGPDAFEFLQGQLTNDLRRLDDAATLLSAWCNPKGRVICIMSLEKAAGGYACAVPTELVDGIVKRLTMFRFRAKVDFSVRAAVRERDAAGDIAAGLPFIGIAQTEKYTPHMLNLDLLDAISFDKGCYTGQEIVARTHYKGATKRRTFGYTSDEPVAVGDKVSADGRDIGEVVNVAAGALLAVIPVDKAGADLRAGDAILTPAPLPYR